MAVIKRVKGLCDSNFRYLGVHRGKWKLLPLVCIFILIFFYRLNLYQLFEHYYYFYTNKDLKKY